MKKMRGYSVQQKTYTTKSGEKAKTSNYHCFFRDHKGSQRSMSIGSKALAHRFGSQIVFLVESRRWNERPNILTVTWLRGLPSDILAKLDKMDLLTNSGIDYRPLTTALEDYNEQRTIRGVSAKGISEATMMVEDAIDFMGVEFFAEITYDKVRAWVDNLATAKDGTTRSPNTITKYLTSLRLFGDYMSPGHNPVSSVPAPPQVPSQGRRALRDDEIRDLFAFLRASDTPHHSKRLTIYRTALVTGLRLSELRKLKRRDLDHSRAMLKVPSGITKNKKSARIPIPSSLVSALLVEADRSVDGTLLSIGKTFSAAKVLRQDLLDAGVDLHGIKGEGVCFHSLRYSFVTYINSTHLPEAVRLQMARHAKVATNMNYTDFAPEIMQEAWEKMSEVGI